MASAQGGGNGLGKSPPAAKPVDVPAVTSIASSLVPPEAMTTVLRISAEAVVIPTATNDAAEDAADLAQAEANEPTAGEKRRLQEIEADSTLAAPSADGAEFDLDVSKKARLDPAAGP